MAGAMSQFTCMSVDNDRFRAKMGKVMPQWKLYENILKSEPLGYEDWKY